MKKLKITLQNCYGIKNFCEELDFNRKSTIAIYASNGTMKTSFAKTFEDLSLGHGPKDLINESNVSKYEIKDENDKGLKSKSIFVVKSYTDVEQPQELSTLMVNAELQKEFTEITKTIKQLKNDFLDKLKILSGITGDIKNVEEYIKEDFKEDDFFEIIFVDICNYLLAYHLIMIFYFE